MKKKVEFFLDLNRCVGCDACIVACAIENAGRQGENWREVYTLNETRRPEIPLFHLSMSCNHCGDPACIKACPAGAYTKDPETGAVIINQEKCLGCKYCTWACPYDAPRYNKEKKVIEKCDFCNERLKKDEAPACVCACPVNALRYEDMIEEDINEDSQEPEIEGFTNAGLQPSIRFKLLRERQHVPEQTAPPSNDSINRLFESSQKRPQPKITLKSEWTLVMFTTIAFILVALITASLTGNINLDPFIFIVAGAFGMASSAIHLGQKQRAYRAITNLKTSWLSREIFLFSSFLGITFIYLKIFPESRTIGWAGVFIGYLSLFAIDRIYQVAIKTGPLDFHSAHSLFNGLYLAGALTGNIYIFSGAGVIKLILYLNRKIGFKHQKRKIRPLVSVLRIGIGFIIPASIIILGRGNYEIVIASVLIGEIIDRIEYYDELDIITPCKQMLVDLKKIIKTQADHRLNERR